MSARVRQSTATPGSATFPEYQPPTFALNPDAQRSIANLLRKHNVTQLEHNITQVQDELAVTGAELHDKLHEHEATHARRQARQNQASQYEQFAEFEQQVKKMRENVESMTDRMEREMRALIDCSVSAKAMQEAVALAEADAKANASTQASTQHTQTQRRSRRNAGSGEDEDEDEEEGNGAPQWEPTDPAGASQHAPKDIFDKHVQRARDRFQAMSLYQRYAENAAYVNFKQFVHDAQHPEAETSEKLPDASQWFTEAGAPPPGTQRNVNGAEESDDDIAIVRGQISTRCPLTLQEFKEPFSSRKCRHIFEAHAILSLIAGSAMRPKAAQCPVPGCSAILEKGDIYPDKLLTRQIRRIQKAKLLQEQCGNDSDSDMGEGTQRRGHFIDDDDDEDVDGISDMHDDGPQNTKRPVKPEPKATGSTSRSRPSQALSGTQVVDLDESDEDAVVED